MTTDDPLPPRPADTGNHPDAAHVGAGDGRQASVQPGGADAMRRDLAGLGVTEADVAGAVAWARSDR